MLNLSGKAIAILDLKDFILYGKQCWILHNTGQVVYASRLNSGKRVYLHREIMKAKSCEYVDHINGDSLDNRRDNLRIVSNSVNCHNKAMSAYNKSGYRGVSNSRGLWYAKIDINGKQIGLGRHMTKIQAAKAYDKAAFDYLGKFARLNFPEDYA